MPFYTSAPTLDLFPRGSYPSRVLLVTMSTMKKISLGDREKLKKWFHRSGGEFDLMDLETNSFEGDADTLEQLKKKLNPSLGGLSSEPDTGGLLIVLSCSEEVASFPEDIAEVFEPLWKEFAVNVNTKLFVVHDSWVKNLIGAAGA